MSDDQIAKQLDRLSNLVQHGQINLFALIDALKKLIKAKHKTVKGFFNYARISYSPVRQIYFNGHQNRKGSGKPIRIRQMPKIIKKAQAYLFD